MGGEVRFSGSKKIIIDKFDYDGEAPDVFFIVGTETDKVSAFIKRND